MFHFSDFSVPKRGVAVPSRQVGRLGGKVVLFRPGDRLRRRHQRARQNLVAAAEAGIETLRLGTAPSEGGVDPLELVSLIAVHALERCEAHPHGDGERAFYRAARRVELAARACQPDYKQTPASGSKLRGGLGLRREDDSPPGVTPRS